MTYSDCGLPPLSSIQIILPAVRVSKIIRNNLTSTPTLSHLRLLVCRFLMASITDNGVHTLPIKTANTSPRLQWTHPRPNLLFLSRNIHPHWLFGQEYQTL